jgi:dienelactone hydrolase
MKSVVSFTLVLAAAGLCAAQTLPPLLEDADGRPIETVQAWSEHSAQVRDLILDVEYGHPPVAPEGGWEVRAENVDERVMFDGAAVLLTFDLVVAPGFKMQAGYFLPVEGEGPFPCIVAIDPVFHEHVWPTAERLVKRGYAFAGFVYHDADPDTGARDAGVYPHYPEAEWGTLSAWAWAAGRLVDHLERQDPIDAARIAVTGHSRTGKAALLAAALDPRFALAAPHASGAGGAGSFIIQNDNAETLGHITDPERFHYWFHPKLREYAGREETLPFDQYFVMGLIAPRALICLEARDDKWANPVGVKAMVEAARPVYALYDAAERIAVHYRDGGHDLQESDWDMLLDFADHIFSGAERPGGLNNSPG